MNYLFCFTNQLEKTYKQIKLFSILAISIVITGCAVSPTFIKPDYDQKHIKSIAIMPVTDERNDIEGTDSKKENVLKIEELLTRIIAAKNYNVVSADLLQNIIKDKAIEHMSLDSLCSVLNVDGILFSELLEYSDVFLINHSIKMNFRIYDSTGDSLWINNWDDNDKPFLSAIGTSMGWAIGVSVSNKISAKDKIPTILAGIAIGEIVYGIVDALSDETAQSIEKAFKSLPDGKNVIPEINQNKKYDITINE